MAFLLKNTPWLLPIVLVATITPFTPALDLSISKFFFNDHNFTSTPLFTFLYDYGPQPALWTFIFSFILLAGSFFWSSWKKWRRPALCLFLTLAIGAGLIAHVLLKDHWGRPRPKQVTEFGGHQPFRPYYEPNFFHQPEPSKSFPCGHCTMGFYFFSVALVGKRIGNRGIFWAGLLIAIALGLLLSLARIGQGGHFFSDTLFAALIMWLTAYACDKFIYSEKRKYERPDKKATGDP